MKFKELTNQGNATFVFSENMKDETNGFNMTMLEQGQGYIDLAIQLSYETKEMIRRNGLDEKEFLQVEWIPVSFMRDRMHLNV